MATKASWTSSSAVAVSNWPSKVRLPGRLKSAAVIRIRRASGWVGLPQRFTAWRPSGARVPWRGHVTEDRKQARAGRTGRSMRAEPSQAHPTAGSSPMQTRIVVPGAHSMVSLLGSRDELLRIIERAFDSDIHVRGNEITITGAGPENAVVAQLFEELIALLGSGTTLTADAVERSVTMLRSKEPERPVEVLTLDIVSSRGKTIRPKSVNQKRYVEAIDRHTIVFSIGPAGTCKTYLAVAKAVEAGERLGFLHGTLYEKIDPYLRPLYDALHDMLEPDSIPRLMQSGTIEVAPLAYMRGRTLNDLSLIHISE